MHPPKAFALALMVQSASSKASAQEVQTPNQTQLPPRKVPAAPPVCAPDPGAVRGLDAVPEKTRTTTHHYGLQNAGFDIVAFGLGAGAIGLENRGMMYTSLVVFAFGSPAVHLTHCEGIRALGSFGLRGGLGAAGLFLGLGLSDQKGLATFDAGTAGLAIGALLAAVIDDAFLAQHEVRPEPSIAFSPGYDPFKNELTLNLSGEL